MMIERNTILLIDDDENILDSYAMALRNEGYRVTTTSSALDGLAQARAHMPDLLLVDINMPELDGRQLLKALREDAETRAVQIVLMTGDPLAVTPRKGMELGADDFLIKPCSHSELLRCVEARLTRAQIHWRVEDRAVEKLRESLSSTLPHELFTPMAGILGMVDILRTDYSTLTAAETQEMLDDLDKSARRLQRTLKNYLAVLDPGQGRPPQVLEGSVVTRAVHRGVAQALQRFDRTSDVHFDIHACGVAADAVDICTVVEEAVDNACSFSRRGTPINVRLTADGVLSVDDKGRGMSDEQLQSIAAFRQFDRATYGQQGLGLGLAVVRKIVKRCGATLNIDSQLGGTHVRVAFRTEPLPLQQ